MRGFAERVGLRRFAAPPRRSIPLIAVEGLGRRPIFRGVGTAVGWAVLLVSTSVEVCVARERARGLETPRSRQLACRARCYAARWCQRCVRARFTSFWLPCVFCVLLRVRAFVLQAAWRGVAVVCLVWVFASFGCKAGHLTRAARVKSGNSRVKYGITGFFYCIIILHIFFRTSSPPHA